MAQIVRYRTGINDRTGAPLRGRAHLVQSLAHVWLTRTDTLPMLLGYGSKLRGFLSEDITPSLALEIYRELVETAHRWEPEVRLDGLQLVYLTRKGGLGLAYDGLYYPEGRLGNYALSEPLSAEAAFAARLRNAA